MQGVLFGLLHNALYFLFDVDISLSYHLILFIFTGMGGLLIGILNEKIYNGT